MTILNTASDGFFNVLIVLHRTLADQGPMDRERLLRLCAVGPSDDGKRRRETLLRWTQLGLFKESEEGKVGLDKADRDPEKLPSVCRRLLFSEETTRISGTLKAHCPQTSPGLWHSSYPKTSMPTNSVHTPRYKR
jgi:hypothetical protein